MCEAPQARCQMSHSMRVQYILLSAGSWHFFREGPTQFLAFVVFQEETVKFSSPTNQQSRNDLLIFEKDIKKHIYATEIVEYGNGK